jgi:hypothetical protein
MIRFSLSTLTPRSITQGNVGFVDRIVIYKVMSDLLLVEASMPTFL